MDFNGSDVENNLSMFVDVRTFYINKLRYMAGISNGMSAVISAYLSWH